MIWRNTQKIIKDASVTIMVVSIVFGLSALFISAVNKRTEGQYLTFYLQLLSLFCLFVSIGTKLLVKRSQKILLNKVNRIWVYQIIFIFVVFLVSLAFLNRYPFVSLGDEVRDGGLTYQQFLSGEISNPLGYGRYDAHGLLLPEILSPFHIIFPRSALAYRVPAALLAMLSIGVLYLVSQKISGKLAGIISSMVLLTTPIHLFYARTEPIVIAGSLLVSTLLLLFTLNLKNIYTLVITAYFIGFCMNFHASLRPVVIVALGILIALQILNSRLSIFKKAQRIISILIIFIVGFGPRIVYTPLSIFFHTSRLVGPSACPVLSFNRICISSYANYLFPRYFDSLKVWFFSPTSSWYPHHQPIYPKIYLPLFLLGLFTLYKRTINKPFKWLVTALLLTIPLTNSAITDMINADHRLLVLAPLGALIIGLGLESFGLPNINTRKIKKYLKHGQIIVVIGLVIISTYRVGDFFINKRADKSNRIIDYLFMHTLLLIQKNPSFRAQPLVVQVSPDNAVDLNYLHYQEQRQYFTPKVDYNIIENRTLPENQLILGHGSPMAAYNIFCERGFLNCPRGYTAGFTINITGD